MSDPKFKVGDKVVLSKHSIIDGSDSWNPDMDQHVGKVAEVIEYRRYIASQDQHSYWVDLTGHNFFWREEAMTPVAQAKVVYGRHCNRCQDWNEYIPSDQKDYRCYGCRN